MKRIHPHFAALNTEGWAFDVEDDSPLSDATPLRDVFRAFNKHCQITETGQAMKAVANGRTMYAVSPWFACRACGDMILDYNMRPHLSLSGRKYCGPCAAKALVSESAEKDRAIMERKQKQRRAS